MSMIVRTILAVRAFGIVAKNGDAVFRRSTTSENLSDSGEGERRGGSRTLTVDFVANLQGYLC